MQSTLVIRDPGQAAVLLKPIRVEVLQRLAKPRTCTEIARERDEPVQKIYYHVKQLEKAGLVKKVGEQRVRAIMEGLYQASASSYYLSSSLVGALGGRRRVKEKVGLGFLLSLADEIREEVAVLSECEGPPAVCLGLSSEVEIAPERRQEFLGEVESFFKELAANYGLRDGDTAGAVFRLRLACYQRPSNQSAG